MGLVINIVLSATAVPHIHCRILLKSVAVGLVCRKCFEINHVLTSHNIQFGTSFSVSIIVANIILSYLRRMLNNF